MKKHKCCKWITSFTMILCMLIVPMTSLKAKAHYVIVFKAGLHGTINKEKSISYQVAGGAVFPDEPSVKAEEGYVFKGWNKALPEVGSKVEGKQVFVAQYDVLVSGKNYIVKYVNEDNVEIATPKANMAELGSTVTERAKIIPGYAHLEKQKEVKIDTGENVITFQYKLTNPKEVIRYEREVIDQVVGDTNNTTQGTTNNPGNNNGNNGNNDEVIDDNDVPLGKGDTEIDDEQVPLGKGDTANDDSYLFYIAGACVIVIAGLGLYVYLYKKRSKKEKA